MNKYFVILFGLVFVVLAVMSGSQYLSQKNTGFNQTENVVVDTNSVATEDVVAQQETSKDIEVNSPVNNAPDEVKDTTQVTRPGSYEAYSPEKLALAKEGSVVLFFRASWCPTCRGLDSDIKSNLKNIPAGVTILDVDYDNSTPLKQKYGVTYQHTLVQVDSTGNQIVKWKGSTTLAALLTNIK